MGKAIKKKLLSKADDVAKMSNAAKKKPSNKMTGKQQYKLAKQEMKTKKAISNRRDNTVRALGVQAAGTVTANQAEREKTKRHISDNQREMVISTRSWNSLLNGAPDSGTESSSGNLGSTGSNDTSEYGATSAPHEVDRS